MYACSLGTAIALEYLVLVLIFVEDHLPVLLRSKIQLTQE